MLMWEFTVLRSYEFVSVACDRAQAVQTSSCVRLSLHVFHEASISSYGAASSVTRSGVHMVPAVHMMLTSAVNETHCLCSFLILM